jgi:hypothetical protein
LACDILFHKRAIPQRAGERGLKELLKLPATCERAKAEVSKMFHWCLTQSHQSDGSFKVSDLDDTLGDAFRYGVWFLQETGCFNRRQRFWTDEDFPESKTVRDHIEAKLKSMGLGDPALKEAYDSLQSAK